MTTKISDLVNKIAKLENQLLKEFKKQEGKFEYKLEGTRIEFEARVPEAH